MWYPDILITTAYSSFIWNSDLTPCPVLYLETPDKVKNHLMDQPSKVCRELVSSGQPTPESSKKGGSVEMVLRDWSNYLQWHQRATRGQQRKPSVTFSAATLTPSKTWLLLGPIKKGQEQTHPKTPMPEIQVVSTIATQHRSLDLEQNLCIFSRSLLHTSLDQEEEILIKICSGLNGWIILVPFQGKIWFHLVEYLTLLPDLLLTNSGLELWLSTRGEPLSPPQAIWQSLETFLVVTTGVGQRGAHGLRWGCY